MKLQRTQAATKPATYNGGESKHSGKSVFPYRTTFFRLRYKISLAKRFCSFQVTHKRRVLLLQPVLCYERLLCSDKTLPLWNKTEAMLIAGNWSLTKVAKRWKIFCSKTFPYGFTNPFVPDTTGFLLGNCVTKTCHQCGFDKTWAQSRMDRFAFRLKINQSITFNCALSTLCSKSTYTSPHSLRIAGLMRMGTDPSV